MGYPNQSNDIKGFQTYEHVIVCSEALQSLGKWSNSCIRYVLEYASPLWRSSLTRRHIEQMELLFRSAPCRIILGRYRIYILCRGYGDISTLLFMVELREQLLRDFIEKLHKSEHNAATKSAKLASGSLLSVLLLIIWTMKFYFFCCCFVYIFVCNSDISIFDCISVHLIP